MEKIKEEIIVIKTGSGFVRDENGVRADSVATMAKQIVELENRGKKVIWVASGAVAVGLHLLGEDPSDFNKQCAAVIGQPELTSLIGEAFESYGRRIAQFLPTSSDVFDLQRPLGDCLDRGVIPVVNGNDCYYRVRSSWEKSGREIVSDNDRLAGFTASRMHASRLILLTNVNGVLDVLGGLIHTISISNPVKTILWGRSRFGTGGMGSKFKVAFESASSGIDTWIANANRKDIILKIDQDEGIGTKFVKEAERYG